MVCFLLKSDFFRSLRMKYKIYNTSPNYEMLPPPAITCYWFILLSRIWTEIVTTKQKQ